eukprot:2010220-Amphidinium_carterae.1
MAALVVSSVVSVSLPPATGALAKCCAMFRVELCPCRIANSTYGIGATRFWHVFAKAMIARGALAMITEFSVAVVWQV